MPTLIRLRRREANPLALYNRQFLAALSECSCEVMSAMAWSGTLETPCRDVTGAPPFERHTSDGKLLVKDRRHRMMPSSLDNLEDSARETHGSSLIRECSS
jgi:hypothetical protein